MKNRQERIEELEAYEDGKIYRLTDAGKKALVLIWELEEENKRLTGIIQSYERERGAKIIKSS